jgi:Protein of unknown function (DUF1501)
VKKHESDARVPGTLANERRSFLLKAGLGLGGVALNGLSAASPGSGRQLDLGILGSGHVNPRVKRVIFLFQFGAVSQVDTFDYKPMLIKMHAQDIPAEVRNKVRVSAMSNKQSAFPLVAPLAPFRQYGQSGAWASDLVPHMGKIADELCFIKTVQTEHVNHDPAGKFIHTGFQLSGRPSDGAWVSYALGSDNDNLPSFVVMISQGLGAQGVDGAQYGSGFLPSHHQGVLFRSGEDPVLYVKNPPGMDREQRRAELDAIKELSMLQHERSADAEILSKVSQYEMAYRMQESVPEIADLDSEPEHVLDLYGPDVRKPGTFARNCLIARRLAERDVKFISVIHTGWDHHIGISKFHPIDCRSVDQPSAGLVRDLKQRGLLEDTLVIFGSEFGRTSFAQGALTGNFGRDHHGGCFTYWLAGAGVKRGFTLGETDDFSYNIVKDPVSVHDVQATMLHLLGIEHERLTYHFQGRDFRLTDVHGKVIKPILT